MKNNIIALIIIIAVPLTSVIAEGNITEASKAIVDKPLPITESVPELPIEPDYYIDFNSCHYSYAFVDSVKEVAPAVQDAPGLIMSCSKIKDSMYCSFELSEDHLLSIPIKHDILYDTYNLLYFQTEDKKEIILINVEKNAAALTHTMLTKEYIGHKTCSGTILKKER